MAFIPPPPPTMTAIAANAAAAAALLMPGQLELEDYEALLRDQNLTALFGTELENATAEQKRHLLMALQPPIELTDVLPPPNHDDVQVQVMAVGYMLLFLLGTCGNVAVLTTIYQMVRSRRANLDNTLIYMIVLSCVDFGVCLSLPFTVIDQILGFWMFGSTMCKLHAVLENFGKILSALIITAMSFDRFAGVCHSEKRVLRSRRIAICILIGMAIYALVALCPLLYNFEAREVILFQKATGPNKVTRMRIEKCTMVDMVRWTFTLFTCFLFVLCYLVPLFLVTFFYTKLLSKLHHHARQFKSSQIRSQIPLMRISLYTLAVACFYFICWTPFWVATAFAVYLEYAGEPNGQVPPMFVYFMYFIHALPFTNSAVNWILYGALNGQLQQRVRHGTVYGGGGGGALTSVSVAMGRTQNNDMERTTLLNGTASHCCHHLGAQPQHAATALLGTTNRKASSHHSPQSVTSSTVFKSSADMMMMTNGGGGHHAATTLALNGSIGNGHLVPSQIQNNANKRPSISPAQSIPANSSVSSLIVLAAGKERRPSCPATGDAAIDGANQQKQQGTPNSNAKRYRRRSIGRQTSDAEKPKLANGSVVNSEQEAAANGVLRNRPNGTLPTTKTATAIGGKGGRSAEEWHNWTMGDEEEREATAEEKKRSMPIKKYTLNENEEEEEEESLLLHSTDSVNCLLRIDSQSSTFL